MPDANPFNWDESNETVIRCLGELSSLLAFEVYSDTERAIADSYRAACTAIGQNKLTQSSHGNELLKLFSLFDDNTLNAIFGAPRIAWRILAGRPLSGADMRVLSEAVMFECISSGVDADVEGAVCSADGAYKIEPGCRLRRLSSKTLAASFVLDCVNSPNLIVNSGNASSVTLHTNDEIMLVSRLLSDALGAIKIGCPIASRLLPDYLDVLALRRRLCADGFESGTFSGCGGLILFTNAHLADTNILAEGLVHEVIHTYLHKLEVLSRKQFVCKSVIDDLIESPWSGRLIRLHSFLHACCVWFALAKFWTKMMINDVVSKDLVCRHHFALKGFAARPVSSIVKSYHAQISPDFLKSLLKIETLALNITDGA